MISVTDGDTPPRLPPPLDTPGSVSDVKSMSKSGFVTIIRFLVVMPFTTTTESIEENVERAVGG